MKKKYLAPKLFFQLTLIPFLIGTLFFVTISIAKGATIQNTSVNAIVPGDLDNDGMPSWWEIKYGLDPNDPSDAATDMDNDALSNLGEYLNGTDPTNKDTDGGGMWDGSEVRRHRNPLDPSDDMHPEEVSNPTEPPFDERGDSDGDGISDVKEKQIGTDPHNADTDGDGLTDYEEIYIYHTSPFEKDTDKDGLNDFDEVRTYKTNPTMRDSDFDGLTDYEEVFIYKTDPNNWDTDSGGMSDSDEVLNKSDPFNKEDDFQFVWNLYYGDKPNDLFNTLKDNKIDIYDGMNLTLEAVTPYIAKSITISYNDKSITTEKSYINIRLISPKNPGIYPIQLLINLKSGQTISLHKYVEVRQRGQIISQAEGNFKNIYNKLQPFKTKPASDAKIEILTYDDITHAMQPFVSNIFPKANPSYSDGNGKYFIVLHPGNYLIKVSKPEFGTKEVLFNTDKYTIFSENIYLTFNYDNYIWGGIFLVIFILVWQLIAIITHLRFWISKILRQKPHEVY